VNTAVHKETHDPETAASYVHRAPAQIAEDEQQSLHLSKNILKNPKIKGPHDPNNTFF